MSPNEKKKEKREDSDIETEEGYTAQVKKRVLEGPEFPAQL